MFTTQSGICIGDTITATLARTTKYPVTITGTVIHIEADAITIRENNNLERYVYYSQIDSHTPASTVAAYYKENAYYLYEVSLMRTWLVLQNTFLATLGCNLVVWSIDAYYPGGLDQFWIDYNL